MFEVDDGGSLPSLADVVPEPPASGQLDAAYVAAASSAIGDQSLPIEPTMGLGDLGASLERLFFRKLKSELPEQDVRLPWFECHVPPGGQLALRSEVTQEQTASAELGIYASGIGRGRTARLTLSDGAGARSECASYQLDLVVIPRVFETRTGDSLEVEVVRVRGEASETLRPCVYCGVSPDSVDPFDYEQGQYLDLRGDTVARKRSMTLKLERSSSFSIGFSVPGLPVTAKIGAKVLYGTTLQVDGEFAPGRMYQPYRRREGLIQTDMWAVAGGTAIM